MCFALSMFSSMFIIVTGIELFTSKYFRHDFIGKPI